MPNKKGLRLPSTSGDGAAPAPAPAPPVVTSVVPDAEYVLTLSCLAYLLHRLGDEINLISPH